MLVHHEGPANRDTRIEIFRGFEKNGAQKTAKDVPQNYVLLLTRRHRKRGQKRGLNLWCERAFLAPTPSVRQPLFQTSEIFGRDWKFQARIVRDDFWEGDEDSSFSAFRVRRFTESPGPLHWIAFPVEILTKLLIHWIASPLFTEKPFFSTEKCFVASPSQKSAQRLKFSIGIEIFRSEALWEL